MTAGPGFAVGMAASIDSAARPAAGPAASANGGWRATRALGRAILLVGVALIMAVITGRPDLVVLAAPIAAGAALGLWRRPSTRPRIAVDVATPVVAEGGDVSANVIVSDPDPVAYDLVLVRLATDRWLRLSGATRPYASDVPGGQRVAIPLRGRATRWGRHQLGPIRVHAVAADGLLVSQAFEVRPVDLRAFPGSSAFRADDAMPRAAGMVGAHRSRRPGEGGELAGVRLFAPGDRLRRIDWRVSLRTRQLHVAATLSDRDAEVAIVIDVMAEAGQSGGYGNSASALDIAVRAAAGIADHYLHHGDRVSLVEYGFQGRSLRASSGHRHYLAALEWLLDVRASPVRTEPSLTIFSGHRISPSALLVVLTPLIDLRSAEMLARFARAGRFVVAVDTMPPAVLHAIATGSPTSAAMLPWLHRSPFSGAAARLWRLERENTIGQLLEHGVPVVSWSGEGSLDDVLRQVARMAARPKVVGL